jgi:hypothetical protein
VNHPALVKTSDLPLFSSVHFSPFTSVQALRASDISPVPTLNLCQILVVEQQRKYRIHLTKILWGNSENQTGH